MNVISETLTCYRQSWTACYMRLDIDEHKVFIFLRYYVNFENLKLIWRKYLIGLCLKINDPIQVYCSFKICLYAKQITRCIPTFTNVIKCRGACNALNNRKSYLLFRYFYLTDYDFLTTDTIYLELKIQFIHSK